MRAFAQSGRQHLEMQLPRHLAAESMARREVERYLKGRVASALVCDLRIAVSELVTNAVLHGAGGIELRVDASGGAVWLEVSDEGPGFAAPTPSHGGTGLAIVDALAERWGVRPGSTRVWCAFEPTPRLAAAARVEQTCAECERRWHPAMLRRHASTACPACGGRLWPVAAGER